MALDPFAIAGIDTARLTRVSSRFEPRLASAVSARVAKCRK
jgi:hypothetical protein